MNFKTIDFNRFDGEIMCESETGEQQALCEKRYERYLLRNDMLNTELNYSDDTGQHVQETSIMTMDEYFDTDFDLILSDLSYYVNQLSVSNLSFSKLAL